MVGHTGEKNRERFVVMNLISQKCEKIKQRRWEVFFQFCSHLLDECFFQSRGNKIWHSLFWFNEFCLFDVDEFRINKFPMKW